MSKQPVRVAVTGAAGQIGYSLLFRIASGEMLAKTNLSFYNYLKSLTKKHNKPYKVLSWSLMTVHSHCLWT